MRDLPETRYSLFNGDGMESSELGDSRLFFKGENGFFLGRLKEYAKG